MEWYPVQEHKKISLMVLSFKLNTIKLIKLIPQLDNPLKSYRNFCDVIEFQAILTL